MAMKQTQTKLFDFSDVGLDFCAGSKNLFPDRFKKMLALGYNEQTVSSVAVAGNQVTLTYGGTHGYVADRVLKVNAPELLSINDGEFVIDSVTANTVTMTIDGAPTSIAGNFTTKVASLGWSLEYENANIHVYKFKQLDESDLYLRLCFQDVPGRRNCISPCVGKSFDSETGFITDGFALAANKEIMSPGVDFKWEFASAVNTTHNNYTYSQGYSTYGLAKVVGSPYHLMLLTNGYTGSIRSMINGIAPCATLDYEQLKYPVIIGYTYGSITSTFDAYEARYQQARIGNIAVAFNRSWSSSSSTSYIFNSTTANSGFLSPELDSFNTTTVESLLIYEGATLQQVGALYGLYQIRSASTSQYPIGYQGTPSATYDIDLSNLVFIHAGGSANSESTNSHFIAVPVEEIKIA
ncbi:hypothetical protein NI401_09455 [Acinetobacter indicus]|uniref:hypothetical protein n=1 Tax=Acinetobacter indicus TaxID=756892 RepID=UPI00209B6C5D|nr:hypothetical protein [Acinetobacter indicus]MCO8103122.1 hypothetical protein [Acinetobacter indicus]